MKKAAAILSILAVAALAAFGTLPRPKLTVSARAVAGVVRVKWTLSSSSIDSLTVDVTGPAAPIHRKYTAWTKTDSTDYARPAAGSTIGGTVTATAWRRLLWANSAPAPWSYTEPDVAPDPPGVTVEVLPASATLAPGQSLTVTLRS